MSAPILKTVLQDERLFGFFDNVLQTVDAQRFQQLVRDSQATSPEELYRELSGRVHEIMPGGASLLVRRVRSLWALQRDMGKQAATLLKDQRATPIDGYLEIGYPGRFVRTFRSQLGVKGDVALIDERPPAGIGDRIQFGFPYSNPAKQFVALDNYAFDAAAIGVGSRDLVSCLIGLHHCPEDKLGEFLQKIQTILRPGGIFLLRDHDCDNTAMVEMATAAHSVFNLANDVAVDEEASEVRAFKALTYWIELLKSAGFERIADQLEPQEVAGDPTRNRMLAFRRLPQNLEELKSYLKTLPNYQRGAEKTYLTRVEWHNVDMAQQLADSGAQWTRFAFLRHGVQQWQEFGRAWHSSQKRHGFWKTLSSDHTLMNTFICVMSTFESVYRALLALVCRVLSLNTKTPSAVDQSIAKMNQQYAEWIHETPFYQFPVWSKIKDLWAALLGNMCSWQILKDLVAVTALTLELAAKGLVSLPLRWLFGTGSLKEPEQLPVLVQSATAELQGSQGHWCFAGEHYHLVHVDRYLKFKDGLQALTQDVDLVEISGNDTVQVKVKTDQPALTLDGAQLDSSCSIITEPGQRYDYYAVKLANLKQFFEQAGSTVHYVHDF